MTGGGQADAAAGLERAQRLHAAGDLKRPLEAFQHAAPPHVLDRSRAAVIGVRDLPVSPARPARIHLRQNPGASRLPAAALELLDRGVANLALLVRKTNNVLLHHLLPGLAHTQSNITCLKC